MDWHRNATIEWADPAETVTEGALVAFDHGWLHIWSDLGTRSVPADAVREVRWKRDGGSAVW